MDLGFSYPPKMDLKLVDEAGGLSSLVMESKNVPVPITENAKNIKKRIKTLNLDAIEQEEEDDEMQEDEIMDQEEEGEKVPGLFSNCVFFLSREVPRYSLEFVIKSMGGKVCWDPISGSGSVYEPNDPRITHHLTDRPNLTGLIEGREYLQPQWIYDCINQNKLLKTNGYHPSDQLPPHLSPFVQLGEDDYDPQEQLEPEVLFIS
jgi:pescadillo protein